MRAILPSLLVAACLASCNVEVSSERTTGGALEAGEPSVVRVCRAATSMFRTSEPTGARTIPLASPELVRMIYEPEPGGMGLTVECAFQGDQVTWRLLSVSVPDAGVTAPAQRAPETATFSVEGDTVRLRQEGSTSTTTQSTWTSTVTGGSSNSEATTEAE